MTTRTATVAFSGIDVLDIDVQVQVAAGMPAFTLVGLPDKAVGESRERVRAAFNAIGLTLPPKRITVNLAPADLLKEGSHFDLPIALGLLAAMGVIPADEILGYLALGELGLDGSITSVAGVLPAAIAANASDRGLICPAAQGSEAAWAGEVEILAAPSLLGLINHFKGSQILARPAPMMMEDEGRLLDLRDIKGQESAKRALEIAAAGAHNLLRVRTPRLDCLHLRNWNSTTNRLNLPHVTNSGTQHLRKHPSHCRRIVHQPNAHRPVRIDHHLIH